jgi:integrase
MHSFFGDAKTADYVKTFGRRRKRCFCWRTASSRREKRSQRPSNRTALAQINLHWHDLRHEALSRSANDGVPVHELQMLAGHASIATTQRYMNARANSLAQSMRQARNRRIKRRAGIIPT